MPWKVIEFQDPAGDVMVARVPQEGTAELITGSQLIVQDGQVAAFFHDGKPTDSFRAGRYPLSTQNLPVLGKILNIGSLGKSPFRSYVYYIALKTFTDMGWGTSAPILFRDTEFKIVNLRAFGSFAVRIGDARTFLHTLIGSQSVGTTDAVEDYLRKIIVSKFAQTLPTVLTTVIDLPVKYEELGVKVKQAVRDQFEQYGIELVDLIVESVTVPKDVQDAINQAAGTRAVVVDGESQTDSGATLDAANDIAAKLKKLKGLLDQHLITPDDFDSQKKRLLDSL